MLQLDPVSVKRPSRNSRNFRRSRTLIAAAVVAGVVRFLIPAVAQAHFHLDAPPSWMSQANNGDPQKTGPCGNEGGGTATGIVTRVNPQADGSSKVTIMWHDTVAHPGHYRIALAVNSRTELPAEPKVTPTNADECASAVVASAPYTLPILADNVNPHTSMALQGNQMLTVTIPASVSCTHCTLQVLEFMSSHSAPCFYHHCADLSIGSIGGAGGTSGAGGTAGRTGGGSGGVGGNFGGVVGGVGGVGGVIVTGGTSGTGGLVAGTGGRAGSTGGAATESGGSTGSGGSIAETGGASASGGNSGSGGNTATGSGGHFTDAATTGGAADPNNGCGCGIAGAPAPVVGIGSFTALLGLCLRWRRRRRG